MNNEYPFIELPKEYFKLKFSDDWKHEIEEPDDALQEVFRAAERQFIWLSEEYDGHIKVY